MSPWPKIVARGAALTVNFIPKVFIFANKEESVYFRPLKDFLFKSGLRDTTFISDPREIGKQMFDNVWPIVIVDHVDGHTDGMAVFDGIYKNLGYELIPFLFLAPSDKAVYNQFALSVGTKGAIKKPLQPNEAHAILKKLIPSGDDSSTGYALVVSKLMLKGEIIRAANALPKLFSSPFFKRSAEVALTRCELQMGQMVQAHARLTQLLEKDPKNIRLLCELAEYYKKNAQFSDAVAIYDQIHELHPQMNIKIWDQILMLFELDHLDAACILLDGLLGDPTFKDLATEGMAHIMSFLGMSQGIPGVLRSQPDLLRQYFAYANLPQPSKG